MCGIFGWQLKQVPQDWAVVAAILGIRNDSRGGDSYGWYNGVSLYKHLGTIGSNENISASIAKMPMVICHTRKATSGGVVAENAHPYEIGNIVGAHNGIISNHYELNKKYGRKLEVDSMQIFAHIDEDRALNEITGYGAIEYIDKREPSKIYLAKFRNGDLAAVGLGPDSANCTGVVWSSMIHPIKEALHLIGQQYFEYTIEEDALYFAEGGTLWTTNSVASLGVPAYVNYGAKNWHYGAGGELQSTPYRTRYNSTTGKYEEEPDLKKKPTNLLTATTVTSLAPLPAASGNSKVYEAALRLLNSAMPEAIAEAILMWRRATLQPLQYLAKLYTEDFEAAYGVPPEDYLGLASLGEAKGEATC